MNKRNTFAINHGYILLKKQITKSPVTGIQSDDAQKVFSTIESSLKAMDGDKRRKLLEKVPAPIPLTGE